MCSTDELAESLQRSLIDELVGRNIGVLSESYTVYAIDLLGFGASDKPPGFSYTMETWAEVTVLYFQIASCMNIRDVQSDVFELN
jgi:pimeloyl-ACP methyl ester carboxylesterase